jgi:hypothetical protein
MSTALSVQPELPSSPNLSALGAVSPSRTAKPKVYSPISGVVGHTFIRLCLWFDLLSSWKKQNYAPPVDGFLNFATSEPETEAPHGAS